MRLARYEPTPDNEFGINPHVDTSFFTLLATTDHSGLVVFSPRKGQWVRARHVEGALIVNTGETLSRITNDTWPATRQGFQMAKFDPFLSLDCARVEGVEAQSKERKGSNFAAQRSGAIVQKPEGPNTYDYMAIAIWQP